MANMASYRRQAFWVLLAAAAGGTGSFVACTDSYRDDVATGTGTGPGGAGGAGTGGSSASLGVGGGATCEVTCSNDLKKVVNCKGTILKECTPDEGCANAECTPNPCEAAKKSKSSYGCDYWALKTALRPQADGACFAAFVANTWEKPVHLRVQRKDPLQPEQVVELPVSEFTLVPRGQGPVNPSNSDPYDPTEGLGVGKVAVIFLSRLSAGAGAAPDCPIRAAVTGTMPTAETGVIDTGRGYAFHIMSDYPVVAYQMVPFNGGQVASSSATLLLPTSAWDTNYIAISAYGSSDPPFRGAWPSLEIVAHQDDTEVTILPNVDIVPGTNVAGAVAGTPVAYTLDAGEFIQFSQPAELTGSPIASNKPIGVIGAHTCMRVPNSVGDCDSAQQQIAPVRATGREYVAVRYRGRMNAMDEAPPWRLVGMIDGTQLTWDPAVPSGAPTSLKLGDVVEFNSSGPFVVRSQDSSHPFYLGGYMTGSELLNNEGDPDWVNVVPPSQYLDYYVFFADPSFPETSLVVVRTPSKVDGSFADVELDCLGPLSGWEQVGNYQYTRVNLMTGNFEAVGNCGTGRHEMASSLPFGVTVWGWGAIQQYEQVSYAYPAGAGFLPINEVIIPPVPR